MARIAINFDALVSQSDASLSEQFDAAFKLKQEACTLEMGVEDSLGVVDCTPHVSMRDIRSDLLFFGESLQPLRIFDAIIASAPSLSPALLKSIMRRKSQGQQDWVSTMRWDIWWQRLEVFPLRLDDPDTDQDSQEGLSGQVVYDSPDPGAPADPRRGAPSSSFASGGNSTAEHSAGYTQAKKKRKVEVAGPRHVSRPLFKRDMNSQGNVKMEPICID